MASEKLKKRFCYSPSKVSNALHGIREGMFVSEASRKFGVPRTTIRNKIFGRTPESTGHCGPQPILGMEVEVKIVEWLLAIAKMGFPINKENRLILFKKLYKRQK